MDAKGEKLDSCMFTANTQMQTSLVKRGLGIGYCNRITVIDDLLHKRLIEIPVDFKLPKSRIQLAYNEDFLTKPAYKFIEIIKEEIEEKNIKADKHIRLIYTDEDEYLKTDGINSIPENKLTRNDIIFMYNSIYKNIGMDGIHINAGNKLDNELLELVKELKSYNSNITLTVGTNNLLDNIELFKYIDKVKNFDFTDMEKYQEQFLLGYYAERPTLPLDKGYDQAQSEMKVIIKRRCIDQIGGDTYKDFHFDPTFHDVTFKQIMAPIYNGHYTYKNKNYPFVCNAQNGQFSGKSPKSVVKVGILVLIIVLIILAVIVASIIKKMLKDKLIIDDKTRKVSIEINDPYLVNILCLMKPNLDIGGDVAKVCKNINVNMMSDIEIKK